MPKVKIPENIKLKYQLLSNYINKIVDYKFFGNELKFYLSHALFSSYDIDDGSRLLLKSIAKEITSGEHAFILDLGCGTGVIGICLKKHWVNSKIDFSDRDHLALNFTEENCIANNIEYERIYGDLGGNFIDRKYDLIVCNIPAKAGSPVIGDIVEKCLLNLNKNGIFALVIIKSFEDVVKRAVMQCRAKIIYTEGTHRHTVLHIQKADTNFRLNDSISAYIRNQMTCSLSGVKYACSTVYNLPEFDSLGYCTLIMEKAIHHSNTRKDVLLWNPGQGHLPLYLYLRFGDSINKIIISSRDLLQLKTTEFNWNLNKLPGEKIEFMHCSFLSEIDNTFDTIIVFPDITPTVNWSSMLHNDLKKCMKTNASCFIAAKSAYMSRILENNKSFKVKRRLKENGFSSLEFQNQ